MKVSFEKKTEDFWNSGGLEEFATSIKSARSYGLGLEQLEASGLCGLVTRRNPS
uniref:Uncharacterized protein n=1 Tax=Hyaloperonospora arabidopsidis (strain Emoy2) TaxID=559515 RepID=M4C2N2_HYAAE